MNEMTLIARNLVGKFWLLFAARMGKKLKWELGILPQQLMYAMFKESNPDIKMGWGKFSELRPTHVLLNTQLPQILCEFHHSCQHHQQRIWTHHSKVLGILG